MKLRKPVFLALGFGFTALVALPLRAIKERTYVSDEISLRGGNVKAEIDGDYYPMKVSFWYDGLQTGAPYRLRIFYRPNDSGSHQVALVHLKITGGGVSHLLPVRAELGTCDRDRSGNPIYIFGFLDVPVPTPDDGGGGVVAGWDDCVSETKLISLHQHQSCSFRPRSHHGHLKIRKNHARYSGFAPIAPTGQPSSVSCANATSAGVMGWR